MSDFPPNVCREHVLGIINLLSSRAGCGVSVAIVLLFGGMSSVE